MAAHRTGKLVADVSHWDTFIVIAGAKLPGTVCLTLSPSVIVLRQIFSGRRVIFYWQNADNCRGAKSNALLRASLAKTWREKRASRITTKRHQKSKISHKSTSRAKIGLILTQIYFQSRKTVESL